MLRPEQHSHNWVVHLRNIRHQGATRAFSRGVTLGQDQEVLLPAALLTQSQAVFEPSSSDGDY